MLSLDVCWGPTDKQKDGLHKWDISQSVGFCMGKTQTPACSASPTPRLLHIYSPMWGEAAALEPQDNQLGLFSQELLHRDWVSYWDKERSHRAATERGERRISAQETWSTLGMGRELDI